MLVNKGHWFLFTVDTVLQCPASVDLNSHWGEAHHAIVSTWIHRPSVDQLLTDTSVKHWRTIGEVSVKYRWTKSYIGLDTSGTTIDRASTERCPTIVRVLTDYWRQYWPSLDWLSTAISTDRSVDTTYSKQDLLSHTHCRYNTVEPHYFELG